MFTKDKDKITEGAITGQGGLHEKKKSSWHKTAILLVVVSLVGGFFVWGSFAYSGSDSIINTYYSTVLGHDADSGGLAYWSGKYDSAKTSDQKNQVIASLVAALKNTQEYKNKQQAQVQNPAQPQTNTQPSTPQVSAEHASNVAFVRDLYTNTLKTDPDKDQAGVDYWVKQLDTNSTKWTRAAITAYFKTKAPGVKPAGSGAPQCTPRKAGESAQDYISRIWGELTARDTVDYGGGPGYIQDWIDRLDNKTWTDMQVCEHLRTHGQPATHAANLNDPAYVQRLANIKALQAAYMDVVNKYIQGGGHLSNTNGMSSIDCAQEYQKYKAGVIDIIYPVCFGGTGVNEYDIEYWIGQISTGRIDLAEATTAIKDKKAAGESICENATDLVLQYIPSCSSGSKYASQADIDLYRSQHPNDIPAGVTRTTNPPGSPRGDVTTNLGQQQPSASTGTSVGATVPEVSDDYQATPYTATSQKTEPITKPEAATTACTDDSTCTTVPLGDTKASSITAATPTSKVSLKSSETCKSSQQVLCNDYAQVWNDGGSKATSETNPLPDKQKTDAQRVVSCVDASQKLKPGEDSPCIKIARLYLGLSGYSAKVSTDSTYDSTMEKVVKDFQADQGTNATDGTVDKSTWDSLKKVAGKVQQENKAVASDQQIAVQVSNAIQRSTYAIILPKCENEKNLKLGATGDCVKRAQQILNLVENLGLPVTGTFDSKTKQVLTDYQKSHNLDPTGVVNSKTWDLLESAKDSPLHRSPFQAASGSLASTR